jgi:hypothetical protein
MVKNNHENDLVLGELKANKDGQKGQGSKNRRRI